MGWFKFLEDLNIVNQHVGAIRGCMDEWHEGIQLGNKLRMALCWEEDDNYEAL
jgi:hypothetical protein